MQINLHPRRDDAPLELVAAGDTLWINGQAFDFSALPDGATLPEGAVDCPWLMGPVERIDGELHLSLYLPCGPSPSPEVAYPQPLTITEDGPVVLPKDPEPEPDPEAADDD